MQSRSIWKRTVHALSPPALQRMRRVLLGWRWFGDKFTSWEEACNHTNGYDEPGILDKVLRATLEVKAGRASYERDSVLFTEPQVDPELLACLLQVAAEHEGRLRVLDFGGSLGTTYWQHRHAFSRLAHVRWDVVEQRHFVAAGHRHIQDETLRFFCSISEAARETTHDVILLSGVLQYLPTPITQLKEVIGHGAPVVLLHNLPLHTDEPDHVRIERVPPEIYPASYPVWFFNRSRFIEHFSSFYSIERDYASPAVWPIGWRDYPSTGLMLRRVSSHEIT